MSHCVTFANSLEILRLDNKCGAYGMQGGQCDVIWKQYIREGWIRALIEAESNIRRELGAPLCPTEICGETHSVRKEIKLRQTPVAYLGQMVYTVWEEVPIVYNGDIGYIEICLEDPGTAEFGYPADVTECYTGYQTLQEPCILDVDDASCDPGERLYRIQWDKCQLVLPTVDQTPESETANFLVNVAWRIASVDESLAYEYVGECNCSGCLTSTPTIIMTLCDDVEGVVCLESTCQTGRRIRVNYATAFDCVSVVDPGLETAVVNLAVVKSAGTAAKPCGCDNTYIEFLLAPDPSSANEFASRLRYGATNAGMEVMRTMDKYLAKPHFNEPVLSGGLLGGRIHRIPTYLRGG